MRERVLSDCSSSFKMFPLFLNTPFKKQDETLSLYPHEWLTQWFLCEDCWSHESSKGFPFWQTFPGWKGKPCIFTIKSLHPPKCSRLATTVRFICQPACMCRQYLLLLSVSNFTLCVFAYAQSSEDNLQELDPSFHCESQGSNCSSA